MSAPSRNSDESNPTQFGHASLRRLKRARSPRRAGLVTTNPEQPDCLVVPVRQNDTALKRYRAALQAQILKLAVSEPAKPGWRLRSHQRGALQAIASELQKPDCRGMSIVHSFGAGKTTLQALLLHASWTAKQEMGLHVPDLLVTSEQPVGVDIEGQILAMSPLFPFVGLNQTINHEAEPGAAVLRLGQWLSVKRRALAEQFPNGLGLLLGDEADLCTSAMKQEAIQAASPLIRIGLSATERVSNRPHLSQVWGPVVHRVTPAEGILNGFTVTPLLLLYGLDFDLDRVPIRRRDYDSRLLAKAMRRAGLRQAVLEIYEQVVPAPERPLWPTLVYLPSVGLVKEVAERLQAHFGSSLQVRLWSHGVTSRKQVKEDIAAFNAGQIDILVMCGMGGRGVNFTRARLVIHAAPSRCVRVRHQLFRGLRPVLPESPIGKSGFEKPTSLVAQIVPTKGRSRPTLLPDVIAGEKFVRVPNCPSLLVPERARTFADIDVRRLADLLEANGFKSRVTRLLEADVYLALQRAGDLCQADEEGFFNQEVDGALMRYGTCHAWRAFLRVKQAGWPRVSDELVTRRLDNLPGIDGRDCRGQSRKGAYLSEAQVRYALSDCLALEQQQADADGFFMLDGKRYATILDWARLLHKQGRAPISWAKKPRQQFFAQYLLSRCQAKSGLTAGGWLLLSEFYSEEDLEAAVAAAMALDEPKEMKGPRGPELYGSVAAWIQYFKKGGDQFPEIKYERLASSFTAAKKRGELEGRVIKRDSVQLYAHSLVTEVLSGVIVQHRAKAKDGLSYFHLNPRTNIVERYAPLEYWLRFLEAQAAISQSGEAITARRLLRELRAQDPPVHSYELPIENARSSWVLLWPESGVLNCPLANTVVLRRQDDFFYHEGQDCAPAATWAERLNKPLPEILVALRDVPALFGGKLDGRVEKYYQRCLVCEASPVSLLEETGITLPTGKKLGNLTHEQNAALAVWVQASCRAEVELGKIILQEEEVGALLLNDEDEQEPGYNRWRVVALAGKALQAAPQVRLQRLEASDRSGIGIAERRSLVLRQAELAIEKLSQALRPPQPEKTKPETARPQPGPDCNGAGATPRQQNQALRSRLFTLLFRIHRGKEARTYLQSGNTGLTFTGAMSFYLRGGPHGPIRSHWPDDLLQQSELGLRVGVERYLPGTSGASFGSYTWKCIFTRLFNFLLQVKYPDLPMHMRNLMHRFGKIMAEVRAEYGGSTSNSELTRLSIARLPESDGPRIPALRTVLGEILPTDVLSEAQHEEDERGNGYGKRVARRSNGDLASIERVRQAVQLLDGREALLITALFGLEAEPQNDEAVAGTMDLDERAYSMLKAEAFANLQELLATVEDD